MSKVLLVTDIYPPDIGGPASYNSRLAVRLVERGHTVRVLCSSDRGVEPEDRSAPFRIHRVSRANRYRYTVEMAIAAQVALAWSDVALVSNLERYVARTAEALGRPFWTKVVGDSVWESARNRGDTAMPFDEFQRAHDLPGHTRRAAERRLRHLRAASGIITPAEYLRDVVVGWGVDPKRVIAIPNGVDGAPDATTARRASDEPLTAGFVGRLTNWKGVETLVLAAVRDPALRCVVVGDGPELPMLRALADQAGVTTRVRFTGRLDHPGVRAEMARLHVLVLGSAYEGMSHALLEAGAMGLPCIASDCCGNPEVITDAVDGRLVPYGDVDALVAALDEMRDEEHRLALATRLRERVMALSFDSTVERTIEALAL